MAPFRNLSVHNELSAQHYEFCKIHNTDVMRVGYCSWILCFIIAYIIMNILNCDAAVDQTAPSTSLICLSLVVAYFHILSCGTYS